LLQTEIIMKTLSNVAAIIAAASALSHNVLFIAAASKEGETITFGDYVFEITTDGSVTAGRIAVDLSGSAAAKATATLTLSGNAVADETVTLAGKVYTWKATPTTVANEVKVGATPAESIDNLVAAITGAAGSGTLYGSATVAHTTVTAVRSSATMVVTALVKGTAANAYASTETMTNGSFGAATLTGGVDPTSAQTKTALIAAFNANIPQTTSQSVTGGILIVDSSGRNGKACTETLSGSGNAWLATATFGLDGGGAVPNLSAILQRTVTAVEDTGKVMVFSLPAVPVAFSVQVRDSTGVIKAIDGKVVAVGTNIVIYSDANTDLAENDVVAVSFAV
jgi:hypothetical protein